MLGVVCGLSEDEPEDDGPIRATGRVLITLLLEVEVLDIVCEVYPCPSRSLGR